MPRFRFVAVDSTGALHDGAINAASEADARTRLASNGLAVRTVEEVAAAPDDPPAVSVPRRAPAPATAPPAGPTPARPRDFEPPAATPRGSSLPLALSVLALVVATATAGYVAFRGPGASRLGRYDFSSPQSAYRAMAEIQASGDPALMMEYDRKFYGKMHRERLDSLEVVNVRDFRGKKVLFVEYKQRGQAVREVVSMERDPDANGWKRSYILYEQVRLADPDLFDAIQKWPAAPRPTDE